jgi:thioredoxin 1
MRSEEMGQLIELTDNNFEKEVEQSDIPVLIDFWAIWCSPCKMIAPIVEELAKDYDGKLKVGKLDVDNNRQTAIKFGIRSIPTLLLFKDGHVADQIVGVTAKANLVNKINAIL